MRIGIDARSLVRNRNGIQRYLVEILNMWMGQPLNHDFYLFAHESFYLTDLPENFHKVIFHGRYRTLWVQYALPFLLRKYKIDLFWSPSYSVPLLGGNKTKYVVTVHDMISYVVPHTLPFKTVLHNRFLLPIYLHKVEYVLTVSNSTKRDITRYLQYPRDRIRVTHLGVSDLSRFNNEVDTQKCIIEGKYILFVGTIEPRKNLLLILNAFAELRRNGHTDYKLVIVGNEGWKCSKFYEWINDHVQESNSIFILGNVNDSELLGLYQRAKLFVYPSIYEGFGLPVIEAMAAGVPVITSDISSLPEITGSAALLIDPSSETELVSAMEEILFDSKLSHTMSVNGKRVSSEFTWNKTAKQTLEVLEYVLERETVKGSHRS